MIYPSWLGYHYTEEISTEPCEPQEPTFSGTGGGGWAPQLEKITHIEVKLLSTNEEEEQVSIELEPIG